MRIKPPPNIQSLTKDIHPSVKLCSEGDAASEKKNVSRRKPSSSYLDDRLSQVKQSEKRNGELGETHRVPLLRKTDSPEVTALHIMSGNLKVGLALHPFQNSCLFFQEK